MKNNKGITLIALVITIIVLLILAGVTINAIVGNESAMEKAKEAKLEDEKGNELDTIKLAVVDGISIGDTGLLTLDNLKTALRKIPAVVEETEVNKISGRAPWTVKAISGREYDITQYGQVTDSTPRPAGLYNDNGYTSWDKLIEDGIIKIQFSRVLVNNTDALNGDLVIIDDGSATSISVNGFRNCKNLTNVIIPKVITEIGQAGFYGCENLESIVIPQDLTNIGDNAFCNCSSLTSINIPEEIVNIGTEVFKGCSSLTSVTIPETVISIGNSAFYDCSSLNSVIIPESVTSIGAYAFYGCSSLNSVIIPESVTSIGASAFYGCSSLTSVTISEGVTQIGGLCVFSNCSSLNSVIIPKSVTSIFNNAFYNCNSLTTINYTGTEEEWNAITIYGGNKKLESATKNYNYVPES